MELMGIMGVAGITVICYFIAAALKLTPLANKWLPSICGLCGALLGIVGLFFYAGVSGGGHHHSACGGHCQRPCRHWRIRDHYTDF